MAHPRRGEARPRLGNAQKIARFIYTGPGDRSRLQPALGSAPERLDVTGSLGRWRIEGRRCVRERKLL